VLSAMRSTRFFFLVAIMGPPGLMRLFWASSLLEGGKAGKGLFGRKINAVDPTQMDCSTHG
jgi:hypothetical protein